MKKKYVNIIFFYREPHHRLRHPHRATVFNQNKYTAGRNLDTCTTGFSGQ